jgi:molecular chaperone GrpE
MIFKNNKTNSDMAGSEDPETDSEYNSSEGAVEGSASEKTSELQDALADARDQLLRRTAEMDNMRRRFNQEREQLIFESNKRLIQDLLPTLDDLERTLQHPNASKEAVLQGMELIYKNFAKLLERYGLSSMETVGEYFDVHAHDALLEEVRADVEPGTITKEIQKGYKLNDNVLRHAKVIVAKQAADGEPG